MTYGIIGIVALILGFLYLLSPGAVKKMDQLGRRIIMSSDAMLSHRKITGCFYVVAGVVLIYIGFFWK